MTEPVTLVREGATAEIVFNRPQALNALDLATAEGFEAAVARALAEEAVRVVLIGGAGRAFMAGGDLAYFRDTPRAERPAAAERLISPLHRALLALADGSKPVIACVQGAAAGAGMSLALMADLAIAADDASFNLAYVRVAGNPDCGGSWALTRIVGLRRAMEIALLSETLDAEAALRLGLVNRVVARDRLWLDGRALAQRLAEGPPRSLAATRALLLRASGAGLGEQLDAERRSFAELAGSEDFEEALAAFFGKRRPHFTGR